MLATTGRAAAVLALLAALAVPGLGGAPSVQGNIHGTATPHVEFTEDALDATEDLLDGLASATETDPLPAQTATTISTFADALGPALAQEMIALVAEAHTFPPGSDAARALDELERAMEALTRLKNAMPNPNTKVKKARKFLTTIRDALDAARMALAGIPISKKDATAMAANPPRPTIANEPDLTGARGACTPRNGEEAYAEVMRARARAMQARTQSYGGPPYKKGGPPANWYFAFEGTEEEPGYVFRGQRRPMFGPFEVKFQVGVFDFPAPEGDTGSACVEFDLEGSDPLQFLAVCGRRVSGGVQVFAQSHTGAQGNAFFPGASIAQVRVLYDGTTFTCSAAEGAGAPDFVLANFATYNLAQGETPIVMGLGGSSLTKGHVIGLDEIYITPQ